MKKTLLKTLIMFASTSCFAGAKMQMRPQYYLQQHKAGIDGGIALWQPLFWKIKLNGWLGAGVKPVDSGYKGWASANAEVETQFTDRMSGAFGAYLRYNPSINEQDNSVGVKVSYKLW